MILGRTRSFSSPAPVAQVILGVILPLFGAITRQNPIQPRPFRRGRTRELTKRLNGNIFKLEMTCKIISSVQCFSCSDRGRLGRSLHNSPNLGACFPQVVRGLPARGGCYAKQVSSLHSIARCYGVLSSGEPCSPRLNCASWRVGQANERGQRGQPTGLMWQRCSYCVKAAANQATKEPSLGERPLGEDSRMTATPSAYNSFIRNLSANALNLGLGHSTPQSDYRNVVSD